VTAAARLSGTMGDRPTYDLAACRAQVPILASAIPMNNCSQAPQTDATRAAALRYLDEWNTRGMEWDGWMGEVARAKAEFARLINASAEQIAVCSSVSAATSAVATALDFGGDRTHVVASEAEFPTVGQVWLAQERRGARVCWAPLRDGAVDADAYEPLIDERARVVSACHFRI
jgi:selenocysteine lyase/cysteine desulfurase